MEKLLFIEQEGGIEPMGKQTKTAEDFSKFLDEYGNFREEYGVLRGIKLMEQRMLLACENGTPIEINGRAYFIHNDLQNLQSIFADLEADAE